jgi:hypothetical protein
MKFESLIRLSPRIFVFGAGLDFIKQTQWVLPVWVSYRESARAGDYADVTSKLRMDLLDRLLSLVLYPLAWIGTAIVIALLIAIYDQRQAPLSEAAE